MTDELQPVYRGEIKSLFSALDQAVRVILLKSLSQNQCLLLPPAAPLSVCFKGFCFCFLLQPTRFALVNDNESGLSEELELLG